MHQTLCLCKHTMKNGKKNDLKAYFGVIRSDKLLSQRSSLLFLIVHYCNYRKSNS